METTIRLLTAIWILGMGTVGSNAATGAKLRVGTSRVDITPAPADLPAPYTTIYDKLYIRTILLDNGITRAAIVAVDVPMIAGPIFLDFVSQIARDAGCPPANVMLAASHAHNSIRIDTEVGRGNIPFSLTFNANVKEALGQSVKEAQAHLQPARAGFGRGKAYLAVNRNEWVEKEQRYKAGTDRTGREPFDPSVSLLRFDSIIGEPLAFLINYGIEPVVNNAARSEISADVPGAVSNYIEDRYGSRVVAAFTVGAAGNPAYSAGGGRGAPGRVVPSSAHAILNAMATLLSEEVLKVSNEIRDVSDSVTIGALLKVVKCDGKITAPLNLANSCAYTPDSKLPPCRDYKDRDTEPVEVRIGVLRIGDMAIVHADANVAPKLELRLMAETPLSKTVFVSLNFGPAAFVVDDAAYPLNTYEATASRLKSGCGESHFISGALEMMAELNGNR